MSFRIDYRDAKKDDNSKVTPVRLLMLTVLCFSMFLLLVKQSWPEGADCINDAITWIRKCSVMSGLERFAEDIRNGGSAAEAFALFCRNVIS